MVQLLSKSILCRIGRCSTTPTPFFECIHGGTWSCPVANAIVIQNGRVSGLGPLALSALIGYLAPENVIYRGPSFELQRINTWWYSFSKLREVFDDSQLSQLPQLSQLSQPPQ